MLIVDLHHLLSVVSSIQPRINAPSFAPIAQMKRRAFSLTYNYITAGFTEQNQLPLSSSWHGLGYFSAPLELRLATSFALTLVLLQVS